MMDTLLLPSESCEPSSFEDGTDEELVRRFQSGIVRAFNGIDRRYRPRLIRFLQRKGFQPDAAEELAQLSLTKALQNLALLQNGERLSVWLYRIAARTALDEFRRTTPTLFSERSTDFESDDRSELSTRADHRLDPPSDDPFEIASKREEKENIWQLAETILSDDEFELLWLRYVDDRSDRELEKTTGKSAGTLRVTLHRIKKKLLTASSRVLVRENVPRPKGDKE